MPLRPSQVIPGLFGHRLVVRQGEALEGHDPANEMEPVFGIFLMRGMLSRERIDRLEASAIEPNRDRLCTFIHETVEKETKMRTDVRRGGKECINTVRSRGATTQEKQTKTRETDN